MAALVNFARHFMGRGLVPRFTSAPVSIGDPIYVKAPSA
jgi:hypothetical protein